MMKCDEKDGKPAKNALQRGCRMRSPVRDGGAFHFGADRVTSSVRVCPLQQTELPCVHGMRVVPRTCFSSVLLLWTAFYFVRKVCEDSEANFPLNKFGKKIIKYIKQRKD